MSKKMKEIPILGTHSGTFHCDEALAISMLRRLPTYRESPLVRTRDQNRLNELTIVVDVGGEYDHGKLRYDHHQRGFAENFGHGHTTKLSSAGLVFKHYGKEIIKTIVSEQIGNDEKTLDRLYLKTYASFIEAIDGIDNGIMAFDGTPRYSNRTDLSSRVGQLNPSWNETMTDEDQDKRFEKASALAGSEFVDTVKRLELSWLPGYEFTKKAWLERTAVHPSGRILLSESYAPFKSHIYDIEAENSIPESENALYVIYKGDGGGQWRILAISVNPDSFVCRKAMPEAWRGLRNEDLDKVLGTQGSVFVHASGFTGGHTTKEGALDMAVKALNA